jgi:hypothetical protein
MDRCSTKRPQYASECVHTPTKHSANQRPPCDHPTSRAEHGKAKRTGQAIPGRRMMAGWARCLGPVPHHTRRIRLYGTWGYCTTQQGHSQQPGRYETRTADTAVKQDHWFGRPGSGVRSNIPAALTQVDNVVCHKQTLRNAQKQAGAQRWQSQGGNRCRRSCETLAPAAGASLTCRQLPQHHQSAVGDDVQAHAGFPAWWSPASSCVRHPSLKYQCYCLTPIWTGRPLPAPVTLHTSLPAHTGP